MRLRLGELAHVRASRCGDDLSLAVFAWGEVEYVILARELTVERFGAFLALGEAPAAERHELPRLHCLIFVLPGAQREPELLLRLDPGRQLLASRLLDLEIPKEPEP